MDESKENTRLTNEDSVCARTTLPIVTASNLRIILGSLSANLKHSQLSAFGNEKVSSQNIGPLCLLNPAYLAVPCPYRAHPKPHKRLTYVAHRGNAGEHVNRI